MNTNNCILFTFGIIFIMMGVFSPIINSEFGNDYTDNNVNSIGDNVEQQPIGGIGLLTVLSGMFLWVFGVPFWLNIIIVMMRVIFWVIVFDKARGL